MTNPYCYYFVRSDLSIPQKIIQVAHVSAKIGEKYHGDTYATLCEVPDENGLKEISEYLEGKSIDHEIFFELDVGEYTAIATRPLIGRERNPLKHFRLML